MAGKNIAHFVPREVDKNVPALLKYHPHSTAVPGGDKSLDRRVLQCLITEPKAVINEPHYYYK